MIDFDVLTKAVGNLDEQAVEELLNQFVASNPSEADAQQVVDACQKGMLKVGDLFEKGDYFVGDLIFAGELLKGAIETLKPLLGSGSTSKVGKMVIGTVEGDLHDIGKNIFISMAEAAGFEMYDLGIDVAPEQFVEKAREVKAQIIGLSGVLTLSLTAMKTTMDTIKEAGLQSQVKVILGGNPVSAEVCQQVGADAFTNSAAEGIKICRDWLQ